MGYDKIPISERAFHCSRKIPQTGGGCALRGSAVVSCTVQLAGQSLLYHDCSVPLPFVRDLAGPPLGRCLHAVS